MYRTFCWTLILALFLLILVAVPSHRATSSEAPETPPSPLLQVSPPVWVSEDRPEAPHVEPYLAAHPEDPSLLVGVAVTFPENAQDMAESFLSVFRSSDGGRSWKRFVLPSCRIDPWVSFGAADQVYVSCLGRDPGSVLVHRSPDGGETWGRPVSVPAGEGSGADRPVVVADPHSDPESQTVYVTYGQRFEAPGLDRPVFGPVVSRSTDSGQSFSTPEHVLHDDLQQQPFDAALGTDGSLLTVYMDFLADGRPLAHRRTWLSVWRKQTGSFRLPTLVFEQTERQMPWALAVSPSGRWYVVGDGLWTRRGARPEDLGSGDESNVFVISSGDLGQTWSQPMAVTPPLPGVNFETPAIAVNEDGVVGIAWYDTRHDPLAECFDIYFSASLDEGRTYLPAVRVTPETSCPRSIAAQRGLAHRWSFGGDYSGLAAASDGQFHVFWADSRSGKYQVWTAIVTID